MKTYSDTNNRCAHCEHHFAEHDKMTGPCRATFWVRNVATVICECDRYVPPADPETVTS